MKVTYKEFAQFMGYKRRITCHDSAVIFIWKQHLVTGQKRAQ